MPIQNYIRILFRRGWIMVALAVITAVAAYGFSVIKERTAPVYKSTITILVQPYRTDFGQAQAAKTLLRSYVAWMKSSYRAEDVIDVKKLDMTPQQLLGDVTIDSDDSRLVIQIDVERPNGDQANDIARAWADRFIEWRNEENQKVQRADRIDAQIIDDPKYALSEPKKMINTAAGGILGLLIGMAIVFVLEYLEAGIIRNVQDVNRSLSLPLMGVIPPVEGGSH
jgi:capsular polysaccharide biosynthesis protein